MTGYLFIYLFQVSMTLLNWTIYDNVICEQYYSIPVVLFMPSKIALNRITPKMKVVMLIDKENNNNKKKTHTFV